MYYRVSSNLYLGLFLDIFLVCFTAGFWSPCVYKYRGVINRRLLDFGLRTGGRNRQYADNLRFFTSIFVYVGWADGVAGKVAIILR